MRSASSPAGSASISIASGTSLRQHARLPGIARVHYAALYAQPGAMHTGFSQFQAFDQDVIDNRAFLAKGS